MSIKTELDRIEGLRDDIGAAIREKGGTVAPGAKLAAMAAGVRSIPAGGKRTARFVVGTSTAGWTAADCDYLCDGTDDQVEINAAIDALPVTGGEVRILDGTYNITASVEIGKAHTKLCGNGTATVLKAAGRVSLIRILAAFCTVADLTCDGSDASAADNGIYCGSSSGNNIMTGNVCINNNIGIHCNGNNGNLISGNICTNNISGIYCMKSNSNCMTANTCSQNGNYGIKIDNSSLNIMTGNMCIDNEFYGISCKGNRGKGSSTTITGNICIRGAGASGDYTSLQGTILFSGTNNCVVGNNCAGKAPTVSGTGSIVQNNVV